MQPSVSSERDGCCLTRLFIQRVMKIMRLQFMIQEFCAIRQKTCNNRVCFVIDAFPFPGSALLQKM